MRVLMCMYTIFICKFFVCVFYMNILGQSSCQGCHVSGFGTIFIVQKQQMLTSQGSLFCQYIVRRNPTEIDFDMTIVFLILSSNQKHSSMPIETQQKCNNCMSEKRLQVSQTGNALILIQVEKLIIQYRSLTTTTTKIHQRICSNKLFPLIIDALPR